MTHRFLPIAVVGRGCVLPGCHSPEALWQTVAEGLNQVSSPPAGDWRVAMDRVCGGTPGRYTPDQTWSDRGGYVRGFAEVFEPASTALDAQLVAQLDPVFQWSVYAAQQAWAGLAPSTPRSDRAGVILGNLSYPTRLHNQFAEREWIARMTGQPVPAEGSVHAWNRFMSGLPAMLVARALGISGGSLALDAACASGLYAIKLACDRLQDGRADVMLAGAVNAADQLFLHVGFSALNAMSRSGQSRPFHHDADGLVPAEGAAFVALKRLTDAVADGDRILGVIRGVGLSNDGRSGGFLSPSQAGQVRSMHSALAQAQLGAAQVQYVECHATGTPTGDATEIASLAAVYGSALQMPLGSLKANLGHLITASGVAGLLKVLSAMEHAQIPGTPGTRPLTAALEGTGFDVPEHGRAWEAHRAQRTAAVSSFGFGGNNAHLIVQQHAPREAITVAVATQIAMEFAIVGMGVRTHKDANTEAFAAHQLGASSYTGVDFDGTTLSLPAKQLAFPPADLKQALGQQLMLLEVAAEATRHTAKFDSERTGIYIGMQTDSEVCRYGLRWRWPDLMAQSGIHADTDWLRAAADALARPLDSAGVIGKMPNVPANRLNNQMNICGPGFTVSREELSGDAALELACTAIRRGEIDTALVGAVDLCREEVHAHAAREALGPRQESDADAAVILVVKSLAQAQGDGDTIFAVITDPSNGPVSATLSNQPGHSPIRDGLGHAHAASGLLHIALASLMLRARCVPGAKGSVQPLLRSGNSLQVRVESTSFGGEYAQWMVRESPTRAGAVLRLHQVPQLYTYAAADRAALAACVRAGRIGTVGPCRLAIVAEPEQLEGLRQKALQGLSSKQLDAAWNLDGICYREGPMEGELAYAFTGAASAYKLMGRELLLGMPQLADGLSDRLRDVAATVAWAYGGQDADALRAQSPFYQLAGSSFVCQLHMQLSRDILGLRPSASLGLSSGETNAMFALGVWQDMDGLFESIQRSALYTSALANTFDAVREHWGLAAGTPVHWDNFRVSAPSALVVAAAKKMARVYVTIINSANDCVIGGDRDACQALLTALGNPPAVPLGHDLAIHCEVVTPFEPSWRALHTRPTLECNGVRFYSNYLGGVFMPDRDTVADALTGQALQMIDFPKIVNKAWDDGVRIFVEHGPRNGLTTATDAILADRPHVAVALDRPGVSGLVQAYRAAAQLWCAGVDVNLTKLAESTAPVSAVGRGAEAEGSKVVFQLRRPVQIPPGLTHAVGEGRLLPPAPTVLIPTIAGSTPPSPARPPQVRAAQVPEPQSEVVQFELSAQPAGLVGLLLRGHQQVVEAHNAYLHSQSQAQQAYAALMARLQGTLLGGSAPVVNAPSPAMPRPPATPEKVQAPWQPPMAIEPASTPIPAATPVKVLPGPAFSRQQLEVLAGGQISRIFGERFAGQDQYAVQVRMPEPPLLLCDRVLGIEGPPQSMGQGTIWTETDVHHDSWYLHHGRMPAGIFIESGQADLLLISWLGIDAHNKGERAYRLLGCDLVFHGDLPEPGDTLHYEIKVDGHARQGDVRLFFFHYDCHINGELRISVRNGQAGFFTKQELLDSAGVIWTPQAAHYAPHVNVAPPPVPTQKSAFTVSEVDAYLGGDLVTCFGDDFYWANTHTRTPGTPSGKHNFLGAVSRFDLNGGPAGRGYMRMEKPVQPDDWFFAGHFKNDPCMPGTLMAEACLQAMAFYMAATGRTLKRDGWRYQPVRGAAYKFVCRGQVTPESKQLVYELFVDEIVEGDMPMLYAHVLCSVDGRKAFLCERLGVQLVPDWPLSSMPELLLPRPDDRPLAKLGDFALDYSSLIHCAWGKPSRAFGEGFARYDGAGRAPRLPGPPYHFMTRITELHGPMAQMQPGAKVTAVYDLEPDAWFFTDNASPTMPNCVLMEIALQPCGWLASYTLKRKESDAELLFRNLDGEAVQHREIVPGDRSITTEVELLSVAKVGDLIIEKFAVRCSIAGLEVLKVETVFGFFPPAAMENQKGFPTKEEDQTRLHLPSETRIDLKSYPERLFGGAGLARLPRSKLLMLDRITGHWPHGGQKSLGAIRAEKDVNSREWFFKAHFFQDPVQPGSLGIEAMLQAMQSFMLLEGMAQGIEHPRFEPIDIGGKTVWHYRGQVTPLKDKITIEFEVTERGTDDRGVFVIGDARLWVDGLQIYHAPRIGMRIVAGPSSVTQKPLLGPAPAFVTPSPETAWRLDLGQAADAWILDHCPTYTLPALPLTYELEMMVQAAAPFFGHATLQAIESAEAKQWVAFPAAVVQGRTLVTLVGDSQADVVLQQQTPAGGFVTAAMARLRYGVSPAQVLLPPLAPLLDAVRVPDPYAAGALFHGPALQLMRDLHRGSNGAYATLDARSKGVPVGQLNPGLLDAALHCIPHDAYQTWCPEIDAALAAYPVRVENFQLFGSLDIPGDVEVHARFVTLHAQRFPRTHIRLLQGPQVLAAFDLIEVLLPKGRLGSAPALARRAFLRDRCYVPGLALSQVGAASTQVKRQDVLRSDWLPGTLAAIYRVDTAGADLARQVAIGDHVGQLLRLHPGDVRMSPDARLCRNLPLNALGVQVASAGDTYIVTSEQPGVLAWETIHQDWLARTAGEPKFVHDLGVALMRRFVRRVVLADPEGYAALRGTPVLYLANHQTGIESFLFLAIIASLSQTAAGAIAKREHRASWIGVIHQLAELAMGHHNPLRMLFFDRSDQGDMLRLLREFGAALADDPCSLLVHVDGTRAQVAGAAVRSVSSVLIDLAIKYDMPIVPVRFAGGLPLAPQQDKLEFPHALGAQDYYLGRAIGADLLRQMPYAQRSRFVCDAINGLGPVGEADVPLAGDAAFGQRVAELRASGRSELQAVLRAALEEFPACSEATRALLRDTATGSDTRASQLICELIGH